ncbi:MAG: protein translocase subunit SecD [Rhodospirillaceae bacterium]|nr:protein translocase subunit SecD [Rhodospirillaceae bacterium]
MVNISRGQVIAVAFICLLGLAFALPNALNKNFLTKVPGWLPSQTFNLGLDLQGGIHLLYSVDLSGVVSERMKDVRKQVRTAFRSAEFRVKYLRLRVRNDRVTFRLVDPNQESLARRALRVVIDDLGGSANALTGAGAHYEFRFNGPNGVLTMTETGRTALAQRTVEQAIEILRQRIDPTGAIDPTIQAQGTDRILIQVPGEKDPDSLRRKIGTTAKMTFHLLHPSLDGEQVREAPAGYRLVGGEDGFRQNYLIVDEVALDGQHIVDASQNFQDGRPVVSFRFDTTGARQFCRITQANINRPFAIVLDNKVISAPVIQSAICGGSGIITGRFTIQTANELALLLRAGALPAPLRIEEQRQVGAELGQDSIDAGKFASIIGLILVIVFMVLAYGRFGLFANVALLTNLVLIAAALSLLQATLTLPGIAGIVLTIGMAVDANVLIFERIREEVRAGRTPMSAIDTGYRRALTTIIDSNLTTFIAALLLFLFGSGPVQGFGVTLSIGLATSMFTAIMVTRLFVVGWWRRAKPQALPI